MDFTHLQSTLRKLWSFIILSCTTLSISWGALPALHLSFISLAFAFFEDVQHLLELHLGVPWNNSRAAVLSNWLSPFQLHKRWLMLKSLTEYTKALLWKYMSVFSKWGGFPCTAEATLTGDQWSLSQLIQKKKRLCRL